MSELSTTNSQPARTVEAVTLEIQTLQRQAQQLLLGYAIEIGRRLVEVKAMLPHGQWGDVHQGAGGLFPVHRQQPDAHF